MDQPIEIKIRLPSPLQDRVDAIARTVRRPTAWVIERAIENFVEMESVKEAVAEANAGDFASESEVEQVFAKWRSAARNGG